MVGLAILALVAAGWRKPARATVKTPRKEPILRRKWVPIGVGETVVPLYKRPGILRRLWAVAASSAIAVMIGTVLAIIVAFGTAYIVVTLTDLLRQ